MQSPPQSAVFKPFHVMTKPIGAICNLDCRYCYYLAKKELYPGDHFRIREGVLEAYLRQVIEAQPPGEVTIAWQGGEPTLMGLEFFRHAVDLAERYRRPDQHLTHTLQTNATLLTDEWAQFLKDRDFLVGISIDGPAPLHDVYRVDKQGNASWHKVMRGMQYLQHHAVRFNVLCTVHSVNADRPLEVYRFFRDECGARFVQFIPIVEQRDEGARVSERSVTGDQWGRFLVAVFDEWVRNDVGEVFVQMFDTALAAWLHLPAAMCIFAETCGRAVALEHNGDVYSCDHFVDPQHRLGNIMEIPLTEMVASSQQQRFGEAKRDTLPRYCIECDVRFACNGECPKNRFLETPDGEAGLNYLCAGYKMFFHHVDGSMRIMADLLRQERSPAEIMDIFSRADRNKPCPCGSGRKAKKCHGR